MNNAFELDLGEDGGVYKFRTAIELREWAQQESVKWNWLDESVHSVKSRQQSILVSNPFVSYVQQAEANEQTNPEHFAQNMKLAINHLKSAYDNGPLPVHSNTLVAKAIQNIHDQHGSTVASWALSYIEDSSPSKPQKLQFLGFIEQFLYENNLVGRKISSNKRALENISKEFNTKLNDLDRKSKDVRTTADTLVQEASDFRTDQENQLGTLIQSYDEKLLQLEDNLEKKIQEIETFYEEKLRLKKPVDYWVSQQNFHEKERKKARTHTLVIGSIGVTTLLISYFFMFGLDFKAGDQWRLLPLGLIAMFFYWPVRLLVRKYLSHLHMEQDASERIVLTQEFLAMSRGDDNEEGIKFSSEERLLILNALFRHTQTGIVRDDGSPPNILDLITRQPKP
ncbi:DUF6161 domain-containing protein [Pseudomonadota bacterium]